MVAVENDLGKKMRKNIGCFGDEDELVASHWLRYATSDSLISHNFIHMLK